MRALNIIDLNNAQQDVQHIATVATSLAATAIDRLGNTKLTLQGVLNTIKAFNPRGARVTGQEYKLKDLYVEAEIVYLVVNPSFVSVSVAADLASGNVVIYQSVTADYLEYTDLARRSVHRDNFASLRDAIAALMITGGVVNFAAKAYPPEVWDYNARYMKTPNITLRGEKMPLPSKNCDRLEGGSVQQGRFCVFADNFGVENLGFDLGKYVCDLYYPGFDTHSPNHPDLYTWDGFAFAQPDQTNPHELRRGFYARNVIGLNCDSQSYGHAVLMEGFDGGYVDNVIGIGGIHGLVIKASNVAAGYVAGYSGSGEHVIIKSDRYAPCNNVMIDKLDTGKSYPGCAPWFVPADSNHALLLNPATENMTGIRIRVARLHGAKIPLAAMGRLSEATPATATQPATPARPIYNLDNFKIESCEIEGIGMTDVLGAAFLDLIFNRCSIDTLTINNVADGIAYKQYQNAGGLGSPPLVIGNLRFGGKVTLRAIQCLGFGRLVVDNMLCEANTNILYAIDDTARIHVGREAITHALTTKFSNAGPALTGSWIRNGVNASFRVILDNYGAKVTGFLSPVNLGSGLVHTLPPYLRPAEPIRLLTYGTGPSGETNPILVNLDPGFGHLMINNGQSATGAENGLSLDGLHWSFD